MDAITIHAQFTRSAPEGRTLTVEELIDLLREYAPETPVYLASPLGYGGVCYYAGVTDEAIAFADEEA